MKATIEKREPEGPLDHLSLAITTFGVGYLPLAPGTWGSAVGVLIYLGAGTACSRLFGGITAHDPNFEFFNALIPAILSMGLLLLTFAGIWAAARSTSLFGNSDPPQAVVDEVIGQLITFAFVPISMAFIPLTESWRILLAGFLLFRLFDIWKPYPIDSLQVLPGGIGVCADDILAGVYAGICLSVVYALSLSI
jgi:phosphatidylglycerophosphatase A